MTMLRSLQWRSRKMATLTLRDLPDELVERLQLAARRHGLSPEDEVRNLALARYLDKAEVLERARVRWARLPEVSGAEIQRWRSAGRE